MCVRCRHFWLGFSTVAASHSEEAALKEAPQADQYCRACPLYSEEQYCLNGRDLFYTNLSL